MAQAPHEVRETAAEIRRIYGRGFAALRQLAGFTTQTALADETGFHQTKISAMESGRQGLTIPELEWFIHFFAARIDGFDADDCLALLRRGVWVASGRFLEDEGASEEPNSQMS